MQALKKLLTTPNIFFSNLMNLIYCLQMNVHVYSQKELIDAILYRV